MRENGSRLFDEVQERRTEEEKNLKCRAWKIAETERKHNWKREGGDKEVREEYSCVKDAEIKREGTGDKARVGCRSKTEMRQ